jgi:hypothetical protein
MGIELGECCAETVIRLKRKIRTTPPFKALAERAKSMVFADARAFECGKDSKKKSTESPDWPAEMCSRDVPRFLFLHALRGEC